MENILKGWGFVRVMRLALGILILTQGVHSQEWLVIALGGLFVLMPLLNLGCCGTSACISGITKNKKEEKEVNYEEVL